MAKVKVKEASEVYESSMRNPAAAGAGVCRCCRTFIAPQYTLCRACEHQPSCLDAVVPITYSEHLGQMHTALRNYKDGQGKPVRRYAQVRLAAILWRFLEEHEGCVATAAGAERFDLVAVVPSSTPQRDSLRSGLRTMVSWCQPVSDRFQHVLEATGEAPEGHIYDPHRYRCSHDLDDLAVLLIDDTWTTGGHAQSAGHALRTAGVSTIGFVAIGRHMRPEWGIDGNETTGDRLAALPRRFDWSTCAVHTR